MTTGHYTILWHPYDPERYAELERQYHECAAREAWIDGYLAGMSKRIDALEKRILVLEQLMPLPMQSRQQKVSASQKILCPRCGSSSHFDPDGCPGLPRS